jgi:REP element-mobilizing transposase RayT
LDGELLHLHQGDLGTRISFAYSLIVPRKPLIYSDQFPYHLTARSNNKEWFYIEMEEAWKVFEVQANILSILFDVQIHSFVLMTNHFHMILTTPQKNIGSAMKYFMRETARQINQISGRINHVFGNRYHWTLIKHPLHYAHTLKYVYRNPIRAGLCTRVEDYPFSSLRGLFGQSHLPFFIKPSGTSISSLVPDIESQLLKWLNTDYRVEHYDAIHKALRRFVFELPRNANGNKSELEDFLL